MELGFDYTQAGEHSFGVKVSSKQYSSAFGDTLGDVNILSIFIWILTSGMCLDRYHINPFKKSEKLFLCVYMPCWIFWD